MRTIWHSLAWKEWNEHKWKLVSILAVMWSLMACVIIIAYHNERRGAAESFQIGVLLGGIPMAVFVGLGIAAGEQSRRTLPFLQALPVPMWRVALHKLGFALASLIIPILATALAVIAGRIVLQFLGVHVELDEPSSSMNARPYWSGSWFVDVAIISSLVAASLVIWAAACGINRKDEVSAGAVALVVMVMWWLMLFALWAILLKSSNAQDTARLRAVSVASAPIGFLALGEIADKDSTCWALGIMAVVVVHVLMSACYVVRFGRTDDREIRSPRNAADKQLSSEFLAAPRRFTITAIAWKQLRESGPIILVGLAVIVAIVATFCLSAWVVVGEWFNGTGMIYSRTSTFFGILIALIAGIGVALYDVSPTLNSFWRSRPIQPDLWFWTKFITGLIFVMTAIYAPIGLLAAFGDTSVTKDVSYPDVYAVPAMQIAMFAAAVMMTCLVRQAVYSAILSIAVVYIGVVATLGIVWIAGFFGLVSLGPRFWREPIVIQEIAGLITTFFVCTVIAWLAMRNNWGRTSRY